jgi:hypothetical protein
MQGLMRTMLKTGTSFSYCFESNFSGELTEKITGIEKMTHTWV